MADAGAWARAGPENTMDTPRTAVKTAAHAANRIFIYGCSGGNDRGSVLPCPVLRFYEKLAMTHTKNRHENAEARVKPDQERDMAVWGQAQEAERRLVKSI